MTISENSIVQISNDQISTNLDGKVIAMSLERGNYYNFNEIASVIWAEMERPQKVSELCTLLESRYKVDQNQCQQDVLGFLEKLKEANFIEVK